MERDRPVRSLVDQARDFVSVPAPFLEQGEDDASVRDVYETLRRERPVAYTTVMTMMGTLEAKGYLKKRPDGRAFRYRPARPEQRVIAGMVREFVDRVFDGASRPLLAHLVSEGRLTDEEREELRRLIEEAR